MHMRGVFISQDGWSYDWRVAKRRRCSGPEFLRVLAAHQNVVTVPLSNCFCATAITPVIAEDMYLP